MAVSIRRVLRTLPRPVWALIIGTFGSATNYSRMMRHSMNTLSRQDCIGFNTLAT